MMLDMLNTIDFHLLRPWWLIAILPALALAWFLLQRRADTSGWAAVIDSELLNELLDGQQHTQKKWPIFALLLAWILAACAMTGPCFEKNNQAALKQADAVVILLDLSPSMLAQDVQPSRLQAAHYKILDLLHQRHEGYTGLIAYSGSAHVVAPLSDDTNTIAALVSTLIPNIMPSLGSRVEDAVSEALQLLENSHFSRGRLLLLTDGVVPEALKNIQQQLKGKSIDLDIIGIGTSAGAPIPLPNGNFIKDNNGNILMNKIDETTLQKLAQENGGYYSPLRADDKDIAPLIAPPEWLAQLGNGDPRNASHTVENWQDIGYWLALPCLLLVLLFFRRGVLICLLPLLLLTHQENVRADNNIPANNVQAADVQADRLTAFPQTWKDWWQTPNQQAATALEKNDVAAAAKQFTDPQWKAYAEYQNGQHKEAAEHFAESNSTNAEYNRGNAQAKAGDLQGALDSYEQSLKQKPDFADAKFNRDLVKKLQEEQKKQQDQKNKDQNQQQDQKQQNQDQKDQQQQDQQNQDQQQNQQDQSQQQQQDQQQSDSRNKEKSDAKKSEEQKSEEQKQAENEKKSEEEKQSEEEKKTQEEKEQQGQDEQEKKSSDSKQSDNKKDPEKQDIIRDAEGKSQADKEKQQANEQWLRKVPDDPGGLLKNKFEYYYQLNRQQEARRAGASNEEEQRW